MPLDARQLVVKAHRPWRKWLVLVLMVLCLPLAGWGLFDYGRARAGFDSVEAGRRQAELQGALGRFRETNEALRQQVVTLEQAKEIDRQAYAEINQNLVSLQDEILELKEEVAFYRGIVSPDKAGVSGVRVQSQQLSANGQVRGFTYKLILTQLGKEAKSVRGSVRIRLQGLKNNAPTELPMARLDGHNGGSFEFKFKYFDKHEGDIFGPGGGGPARGGGGGGAGAPGPARAGGA